MRANVYVDGFNLYYGCLKRTPYKWLDLSKLCQFLLPKSVALNEIKYFTALVSSRPNNPQQDIRQQTYIRALQTLPNVSVVYGQFLSHRVRMHLAYPPAVGSHSVEVIKTEEKGSDVNLATEILIDGFLQRYDMAVLVSNDSDLFAPINAVSKILGLPVGIFNPYPKSSRVLQSVASFIKPIRKGVLAASQFPVTLTDANGTFSKPGTW
jgi:uncharacterized LabA/DUF88 family protein